MKKSLALIFLLGACSPVVNSVNSIVLDKAGEERGKVNISFSTYNGRDGKMTLVMSDGEIFNGDVVTARSETDNDMFELSSAKFYSRAQAVLISNRGHSMKCNFDLAEPNLGVTSGTIGECKASNGWIVPVTMSGKTKRIL